jgi:hypothetical protein
MNIYKATFKEKKEDNYWDNKPLLIIAGNYGNAEDKAKHKADGRELISIELFGETTNKSDVFVLRQR